MRKKGQISDEEYIARSKNLITQVQTEDKLDVRFPSEPTSSNRRRCHRLSPPHTSPALCKPNSPLTWKIFFIPSLLVRVGGTRG